jgi:thiol-disulfide isomerase/thioredoxin
MHDQAYRLKMNRILLGWYLFSFSIAIGQVRVLSSSEYKTLIHADGDSLVVVNFWATWCKPCIDEFPGLVRLKKELPIRLLFISVDDPDRIDSVTKYLKSQGVKFLSYIRSEEDMERFINAISPKWSGAVPATFIYDSKGNLLDLIIGQKSTEQFKNLFIEMGQKIKKGE